MRRSGCWITEARVFYKYTDGDKGMFNMLAGSPGGRSVLKAEDLPSADALSALFYKVVCISMICVR